MLFFCSLLLHRTASSVFFSFRQISALCSRLLVSIAAIIIDDVVLFRVVLIHTSKAISIDLLSAVVVMAVMMHALDRQNNSAIILSVYAPCSLFGYSKAIALSCWFWMSVLSCAYTCASVHLFLMIDENNIFGCASLRRQYQENKNFHETLTGKIGICTHTQSTEHKWNTWRYSRQFSIFAVIIIMLIMAILTVFALCWIFLWRPH